MFVIICAEICRQKMYIYADIMNNYAGYNFVANATVFDRFLLQIDRKLMVISRILCANGHKSTFISRKICYNSVIHLISLIE